MAAGKGKADPLIGEMDAFARQLLESVKSDTATAQAKLDTFKSVAAWIAVRNRLADDAEGGDLDAIRSKLRADDDEQQGETHQRKARGRKPAALPGGKGGSALDAIRKRLPRADDDDPGGNSQGLEF